MSIANTRQRGRPIRGCVRRRRIFAPARPFAPEFRAFADAGRKLTELQLSKAKTQLAFNESLTLAGIPPESFEYQLGNRSGLDWVIDQYQVTTDKRTSITSDPNLGDEPRYFIDLVGRVIAVSVETVRIVAALPENFTDAA